MRWLKRFQFYLMLFFLPVVISYLIFGSRNITLTAAFFLSLCLAIAFARQKNNLLLMLLSLSTCILLTEAALLAYFFLKARDPSSVKRYEESTKWVKSDPFLGYTNMGPVDVRESLYVEGEAAYQDVLYRLDKKGRRSCYPKTDPLSQFKSLPTEHAIFLGGSFTFGDGLTNEQTLPCQFQSASKNEYRSYNYGMKGWSTSQILVLLGQKELFDDIQEKRGIAVYSFISDHTHRTTGKLRYLYNRRDYPLFRLDQNDQLEGPYRYYEKPLLKLLVNGVGLLKHVSPSTRFLLRKDPIGLASDQTAVEITAQVVIASKKKYEALFDGTFHVLIWPTRRLESKLESLFISILKNNEVSVIQVPSTLTKEQYCLHEKDCHPSALQQNLIARQLYSKLNARFGK